MMLLTILLEDLEVSLYCESKYATNGGKFNVLFTFVMSKEFWKDNSYQLVLFRALLA